MINLAFLSILCNFVVVMRRFMLIMLSAALLIGAYSCGNRKNAADYAPMLDSIRKAEVAKDLLKPTAGDPVIVRGVSAPDEEGACCL